MEMTLKMNTCLLLGALATFVIALPNDVGPLGIEGHLKPLGSHQPPNGTVFQVDGFLKPEIFFNMFVKTSRAVLFKGACKNFSANKLWNDEFLRKEYGQLQVTVDTVKKENRDISAVKMELEKFLRFYHHENWYLIDTVPREMRSDLDIPLSMKCGGFLERLQDLVIWFSGEGSKSHLHIDTVDNINCMIDGEKKWFLVDLENSKNITMDHEEGDFCSVDSEKVDMVKYPFLRNIPWYNAIVEDGDCIFIPNGWAHQVSSNSGRNIAVNFWWTPMLAFNTSDCVGGDFKSILDIGFSPAEQYRFQLLQLLNSTKDPCNFQCLHSKIVSEHTGRKIISYDDFKIIDSNGNGWVENDEIYQLAAKELEDIFDGEEPGTINIKGKSGTTIQNDEVHRRDEL